MVVTRLEMVMVVKISMTIIASLVSKVVKLYH